MGSLSELDWSLFNTIWKWSLFDETESQLTLIALIHNIRCHKNTKTKHRQHYPVCLELERDLVAASLRWPFPVAASSRLTVSEICFFVWCIATKISSSVWWSACKISCFIWSTARLTPAIFLLTSLISSLILYSISYKIISNVHQHILISNTKNVMNPDIWSLPGMIILNPLYLP